MYKKQVRIFVEFALVAGIAGVVGWYVGRTMPLLNASRPIREDGYHLVSPLLVCARDEASRIDQNVQTAIQNVATAEIARGDVDTASAYYRRFSDNSWALLNGDEKYYPASLNKVPIMIAYYSLAEEGVPVMTKNIYYPPGPDENQQQEIAPAHPIQHGQYYAVNDLIRAMIEDSDNNATLLLFDNINLNDLERIFTDLRMPLPAQPSHAPTNYMDVSNYAFFFRILYNGTYLSHADSEKALDVLTKTDFNDGLVAGVPQGTVVAHKFGLLSVAPENNVVTARELHDCGIVYPAGKSPYLICVMTKSAGTLSGVERAIAAISREVYRYATK